MSQPNAQAQLSLRKVGLLLRRSRVRISPPALAATLKHAASMPNPLFYERQRRRASTWDVPRFLRSYDETLDGGLILPRRLLGSLTDLIDQLGSRLAITDDRVGGKPQTFSCSATLDDCQQAARRALSTRDLSVLVAGGVGPPVTFVCIAVN